MCIILSILLLVLFALFLSWGYFSFFLSSSTLAVVIPSSRHTNVSMQRAACETIHILKHVCPWLMSPTLWVVPCLPNRVFIISKKKKKIRKPSHISLQAHHMTDFLHWWKFLISELTNRVAKSHMCPLSTWNMAGVTEKLNF